MHERSHHHTYHADIADWWCEDCDTVTDYCDYWPFAGDKGRTTIFNLSGDGSHRSIVTMNSVTGTLLLDCPECERVLMATDDHTRYDEFEQASTEHNRPRN